MGGYGVCIGVGDCWIPSLLAVRCCFDFSGEVVRNVTRGEVAGEVEGYKYDSWLVRCV
jgi:hypothetical protein